MKSEDIKPGKRYVIDSAPLVASPEGGRGTFTGKVHHTNAHQAYVIPDAQHLSALYISKHWFIREAAPERKEKAHG